MAFKKKQQPKQAPKKQEPEYDNTNRGVLFQNKNKENENQPDMRGSFTDAEGREYWLAAWSNSHKKYGKYLSISATPKDEADGSRPNHGDDELPF